MSAGRCAEWQFEKYRGLLAVYGEVTSQYSLEINDTHCNLYSPESIEKR